MRVVKISCLLIKERNWLLLLLMFLKLPRVNLFLWIVVKSRQIEELLGLNKYLMKENVLNKEYWKTDICVIKKVTQKAIINLLGSIVIISMRN